MLISLSLALVGWGVRGILSYGERGKPPRRAGYLYNIFWKSPNHSPNILCEVLTSNSYQFWLAQIITLIVMSLSHFLLQKARLFPGFQIHLWENSLTHTRFYLRLSEEPNKQWLCEKSITWIGEVCIMLCFFSKLSIRNFYRKSMLYLCSVLQLLLTIALGCRSVDESQNVIKILLID